MALSKTEPEVHPPNTWPRPCKGPDKKNETTCGQGAMLEADPGGTDGSMGKLLCEECGVRKSGPGKPPKTPKKAKKAKAKDAGDEATDDEILPTHPLWVNLRYFRALATIAEEKGQGKVVQFIRNLPYNEGVNHHKAYLWLKSPTERQLWEENEGKLYKAIGSGDLEPLAGLGRKVKNLTGAVDASPPPYLQLPVYHGTGYEETESERAAKAVFNHVFNGIIEAPPPTKNSNKHQDLIEHRHSIIESNIDVWLHH